MKYMIVLAMLIWFCTGLFAMKFEMQTAAIAHHAAHYDGATGKFTWNDEAAK